ncbi:MAG: ParB/RepB/Spo0J family partition protein [Spirochaetaceae bacterium]|nr:ParB/RepB/Spo0J family partition protein [Spirochaetaceae bacterium]
MSKFGLGKGLGALIPEHQQYFDQSKGPADLTSDLVTIVPLANLRPNPDQPRKTFPDESIAELADSIKRHGLLQPIIAEPAGDNNYIIVAGERRYRAAGKAGLTEIPVIVRPVSTEKRLELSLIENIQREDLNPMEEAQAYEGLMELTGSTQEQVAEIVGKNRSTVANALRLLRLPDFMKEAVSNGTLTPGHARSLLAIGDEEKREKLFHRIVDEGLSVRQAELAVQEGPDGNAKGHKKGSKGRKKGPAEEGGAGLDPNLRAIGESLIERLGTKVEIRGDSNRGEIVVEYYSADDLERIIDVVGVNKE